VSRVLPAPAPTAGPLWIDSDSATGTDRVRGVLRRHASGVAVITAGASAPVGLCVTSLAAVSFDPAVVSFAINVRSTSWPTIETAESVLAHLLGDWQEDLARRFGRSGTPKFAPPTRWQHDEAGLPTLHGVLAWLVLAPIARIPVDNHVLILGRVIRAATGDEAGGPLIHHGGRYTSLTAR